MYNIALVSPEGGGGWTHDLKYVIDGIEGHTTTRGGGGATTGGGGPNHRGA